MVDPETGEPTWECSQKTQDECENPGFGSHTSGTWYEGMSCDDIDCPTTTQAPPASGGLEWACCGTGFTGYCISATANECFTLGGTFYEYYTCHDVASGPGTECEGYGTTTPAPSGTTPAPSRHDASTFRYYFGPNYFASTFRYYFRLQPQHHHQHHRLLQQLPQQLPQQAQQQAQQQPQLQAHHPTPDTHNFSRRFKMEQVLTIGMAHHNDYSGVYFTIQDIRKELLFNRRYDLLKKINF